LLAGAEICLFNITFYWSVSELPPTSKTMLWTCLQGIKLLGHEIGFPLPFIHGIYRCFVYHLLRKWYCEKRGIYLLNGYEKVTKQSAAQSCLSFATILTFPQRGLQGHSLEPMDTYVCVFVFFAGVFCLHPYVSAIKSLDCPTPYSRRLQEPCKNLKSRTHTCYELNRSHNPTGTSLR
jgi:hypothetical protein